MDFIVTDRETIEAGLLVKASYAVISIHYPDKRPAKVRTQGGLQGVLYLAFHDAEPASNLTVPADIKMMTPEQASESWRFVEKHRADVGAIVVHCEQGMSRSPAVALCKMTGGDDQHFWQEYQRNRYVYRLVLETTSWEKPR